MPRTKKSAAIGLDQFIDRLVEEKGLTNLDGEVLAQVKSDLYARAEDRVNATIVEKLPPTMLNDFEKLLDEGSEVQLRTFCQEHIPNLDEAVAAALLSFGQTYLTP